METLIKSVVRNLGVGATIEQIVEVCREKGWMDEDIFLAIKAGQNLYDAIVLQKEELKKRPPPFGRK
jgi:hypothetical protein